MWGVWTDCPEDSCLKIILDKDERKSERTRKGIKSVKRGKRYRVAIDHLHFSVL